MIDMSLTKTASKLFFNGLRFRYKKISGGLERPQAVSLEITHRCMAKCIMCNIWRIPKDEPELSADEWLKFLSDNFLYNVRELDITGGEPFLLDDIDYLFSGISRLKGSNLKRLQSVAVTTNGFLTERVLDKTEVILKEFKKTDIDLVAVCAMDATGNIHEKIRNVKDAWQKVNSTINGLIKLRDRYSNLYIGLKTTILPLNIGELENISQYAGERGLFTIISPRIITGGRYLNKEIEKDLVFSKEDREKMIRFFKGNRSEWSFHTDSLIEYFETGVTRKRCSCGFNYFFIRSSGKVYPCPLINKSIGSIRDRTIKKLLLSESAIKIRRNLGKFSECNECTEPGIERYALPYEGFIYLSMLNKHQKNKFIDLYGLLGLKKYLK